MGLFIVAVLSFGFSLILASVACLHLLILPSFRAVLGASFLLLFVAFYVSEKGVCWATFSGGGGGEHFGLRSYGDVPTFRVDFLTQNILDRVQI